MSHHTRRVRKAISVYQMSPPANPRSWGLKRPHTKSPPVALYGRVERAARLPPDGRGEAARKTPTDTAIYPTGAPIGRSPLRAPGRHTLMPSHLLTPDAPQVARRPRSAQRVDGHASPGGVAYLTRASASGSSISDAEITASSYGVGRSAAFVPFTTLAGVFDEAGHAQLIAAFS